MTLFNEVDRTIEDYENMSIGDRVRTPHGPGTIKGIERFGTRPEQFRFAVKHDVFPASRSLEQFPDELFYIFLSEIEPLPKIQDALKDAVQRINNVYLAINKK